MTLENKRYYLGRKSEKEMGTLKVNIVNPKLIGSTQVGKVNPS